MNGSLILDDVDLVIQAAIDGAGLALLAEDRAQSYLENGTLERVLGDWSPPFPGFLLPESSSAAGGVDGVDRNATGLT